MPYLVRSSSEFLHFTRQTRKIAISLQQYDPSPQIWHDDAERFSSATPMKKKLIFTIQDAGRPIRTANHLRNTFYVITLNFTQLYFTTKYDSKKEYRKQNLTKLNYKHNKKKYRYNSSLSYSSFSTYSQHITQ